MIRGGKLDKPIRVLIVDDEESIVTSTSWWLQRLGYECVKASSVEEAQAKLSETPFDVVVTDIRMPGSTGIDLLKTAKERDPDIQVIVMTGSPSLDFAVEAIRSSADDYLIKPFELDQIAHSVQRAALHRSLLQENRAYRDHLEVTVQEQARQIESLFMDGLAALAGAIEARDGYTGGHLDRVSEYALSTGQEMSLDKDQMWNLWLGSLFHDVGKLAIPDAILNKKGPLTEAEYEYMKKHPELGVRVIEKVSFLRPAVRAILDHQERWDGTGYPRGLRGGEISIEGRILAVCDAFDAMLTDRPYRSARSATEAIDELDRCSGSHFDPSVVEAFLTAQEKGLSAVAPVSALFSELGFNVSLALHAGQAPLR